MSNSVTIDTEIAKAILEAGWRTGCACEPSSLEFHKQFMPSWLRERINKDTESVWVPFVSSQACDLVSGRLSDEPHVEFILGKLTDLENSNIALRRSYRRLQLRHPTRKFAEFSIHDRWLIERTRLIELSNSKELDLEWNVGIDLSGWIGSRYARYPLPNSLAERLQYNTGKQRDALKKLTSVVDEIRIIVTPPNAELKEGENYNIIFYVIHSQPFDEKSNKNFDTFKEWIQKQKGITAQIHLEPAATFSYSLFKRTHRLDLDSITFGYLKEPRGILPAAD